jgi:hypothetical protein
MSGKANKKFIEGMAAADPSVYLRRNLFNTQPDQRLGRGAGRVAVNLRVEEQLINVEPQPDARGCWSSMNTHQFNAFWCGNRQGHSVSVVLNDTANYFFTPALTGCILEINGLTITHHDGDLAVFPPAALANVAQGGPLNTVGHRWWDCPAGVGACNVIGKRTGVGVWQFWQQAYNPGAVALPLAANRVTRI